MLRKLAVRNDPVSAGFCVRPLSLAWPATGSSLNRPAPLNGFVDKPGIAAKRPSYRDGTLGPICGTPRLWTRLSVNAGPEWHAIHPALPTKSLAPRFAPSVIAV